METNEIIARLAKQVLELKDQVEMYEKACENIFGLIYNCGDGPLNDNSTGCNPPSMTIFKKIADELPNE